MDMLKRAADLLGGLILATIMFSVIAWVLFQFIVPAAYYAGQMIVSQSPIVSIVGLAAMFAIALVVTAVGHAGFHLFRRVTA